MKMKIPYSKFEEIVKELKIMFGGTYTGDIEVNEFSENKKASIKITTKDMILETHKESMYLYGAILKCDYFSLEPHDNQLIITLGFQLF